MIISQAEARRLERRELSARMRHAGAILKRVRREGPERSPWTIVWIAVAIGAVAVFGFHL